VFLAILHRVKKYVGRKCCLTLSQIGLLSDFAFVTIWGFLKQQKNTACFLSYSGICKALVRRDCTAHVFKTDETQKNIQQIWSKSHVFRSRTRTAGLVGSRWRTTFFFAETRGFFSSGWDEEERVVVDDFYSE
jgi:hypothetical protein